jgi:hypothetical protein
VDAGFPPASRARLLEKITFMTSMSIHRNIEIEDVDPSKHRDRRCRSIETSRSKWIGSIQSQRDLELEFRAAALTARAAPWVPEGIACRLP